MKAIDLIKQFEGCKLTAYQDIVGVWTIGWGTTGPEAKPGRTVTQAEADALLQSHIDSTQKALAPHITAPVSANQLAALICFAYNVGVGACLGSTLLKKLNAKDSGGAADEFLKWDKAGGKEIAGLKRRREAERALFLSA